MNENQLLVWIWKASSNPEKFVELTISHHNYLLLVCSVTKQQGWSYTKLFCVFALLIENCTAY